MKQIYCIASGEYSDWGIDYAFESKEKRDKFLSMLDVDYHEYNLELNDENIDVEKIKPKYFVEVGQNSYSKNFNVDFWVDNSFTNNTEAGAWVFSDGFLSLLTLEISKENYDKRHMLKNKYIKAYNDYSKKVEYMSKVEGLDCEQIQESLNSNLRGDNNE